MKKILTLALCLSAVASMSAQKQVVDQASKMAGKIDKIADARALINEAMANPETSNDVRTYFTAGKIEFDAFDEAFKKRAINPDDKDVNVIDMGNEIVNGFNYFVKALPLDSVPNEKGQVKPKYSKDMISKMNGHHNDYFNYGGELFNNKHYFPEAYNAFMIYGDMPSYDWADKAVKATPDSMIAMAYHYAGIGAFSGNDLNAALVAFEKARKAGIKDPQNYVYEIACWQNIAMRDSTKEQDAKTAIQDIAMHGYKSFGVTNPLFINNLVNTMSQNQQYDDAIALITEQINQTPDLAFLYGLRGFINDRRGDDDGSLADYAKAASFADADIETMKNASKKFLSVGQEKWNNLETNDAAGRAQIKNDYWKPAKEYIERAATIDPSDTDVPVILDRIEYVLEL